MAEKYIANDSVFTAEDFAKLQAMSPDELERYLESMRNTKEQAATNEIVALCGKPPTYPGRAES